MQVIDHNNQRSLSRQALEQLAECPEDLGGRPGGLSGSNRGRDPLGYDGRILFDHCRHGTGEIVSTDIVDDLGERPVCDPLAVGKAVSGHNASVLAHGQPEFVGEA